METKIRGIRFWLLTFTFIIVCLLMLFPVYWGLVTSLKDQQAIYAFPPTLIPPRPTLQHYGTVLFESELPRQILNSLIVSVLTIVTSVFLGTFASYGFSRWEFRGKQLLLVVFLFALMIPGLANLISIYMIFTKIRITNTYLSLVIVYSGYTLPVVIWLMKTFVDKIPRQIDEAAVIDGCSYFTVFNRIILPICKPGLVAAAIFVLITTWIEFIVALILITVPNMKTATVGVYDFISFHKITWGPITAASMTMLVPVILFFAIFQKHLVIGLTRGAIKG